MTTYPGTAGNDSLVGGSENDSITGDAGDDTLIGGAGKDTLDGGTGNDVVSGDSGADLLIWAADRARPRLEARYGASTPETTVRTEPVLGENAAEVPEPILMEEEIVHPTALTAHTILVGFGRVGSVIAAGLERERPHVRHDEPGGVDGDAVIRLEKPAVLGGGVGA